MTVIKIKNSNIAGRVPAAGDLQTAELALNLQDKRLYSKDVGGNVFEIGTANSGDTPPITGNQIGDLFYDTAEGALKYWDGNAWVELSTEPIDGEGYVKKSGDNMSGPLTIGPDAGPAVTTLADDGSATFASTVTVDSAVAEESVNGLEITGAGDSKVRLTTDGRAFFSGGITGDYLVTSRNTTDENNTLLTVGNTNGVKFVSKGTGLFLGNDLNNLLGETPTGANISIKSDGSATFAGNVTGNVFYGAIFEAQPSTRMGSNCIVGTQPADAATNDKVLQLRHNNPAGNGELLRGRNATNTETVSIKADGSASFAGSIKLHRGTELDDTLPALTQTTKDTTTVSENQSVIFSKHVCRAGSSNAYMYWKVSGGGTTSTDMGQFDLYASRGNDNALTGDAKITLKGDGSATFAGTITQAENSTTRNRVEIVTAGGGADKRGAILLRKDDASASQQGIVFFANGVETSFIRYNGSTTFNLEADNPANYTTTTDAEGNETQVYNGPTLDVKQSLEEAIAARDALRETFQELQIAVANATDFSGLKAAMMVALEDYA